MNFKFSKHAKEQMESRMISEEIVLNALIKPDQIRVENDATVYQKIVIQNSTKFLLRIFVNDNVDPKLVITVYKTSKINKYYES